MTARSTTTADIARRSLLPVAIAAVALGSVASPTAATSAGTPDPARFTTAIDNPYLPFPPGTRMVYRERGDDGPGRVVVRVTHRTKTVQGVETVVVRDRAYSGGELVEDTRDWYAQ